MEDSAGESMDECLELGNGVGSARNDDRRFE
jgi:hypothetical protein